MLRSMYSGISGMKVNQTKLDVTGNNIANVGTTGFKSSRVRFQDMLSQNVSEALGPGRNTGGVNARQVGLGVQVAGIDTVVTQGMMQPTSRNLDVAVDGTGYFVVARGELPQSNANGVSVDPAEHSMSGGNFEVSYSRDGAFTLDYQGNLLTSDGYRVMGYVVHEKGGDNANTKSISYGKDKTSINFVDADSEFKIGVDDKLVPLRIPDSVSVLDYNMILATAQKNFVFSGAGDNSLVTAQPKIDTNDNQFVGQANTSFQVKYVPDATDPTTGKFRLFANGKDMGEASSDATLYVTKNGNISTTDPSIADTTLVEGVDFTAVNYTAVDTTPITAGKEDQYSWNFSFGSEKKIRSFSIEKDGVIKAVLDDGSVGALGQLAMASFKNAEGLKKVGKNMLERTANSGEPIIRSGVGTEGANDNSDGYGDMLQGMLEMSNVDLAEQFTDMITTTRAFQAAGKMITTGDEILQDIINLKR